jgi:thiamine pyrophosphate-dependent enzyme
MNAYAVESSKKEKPALTKTDGHTLVAQNLKCLGVTHVYCLAGTPIRETFSKCAELGIRPIGVRHQQAAVLMALAQNYATGRLTAVALLSAGPAITNAATNILVVAIKFADTTGFLKEVFMSRRADYQ